MKFKNILVSVSDKSGLDDFIKSVLSPGGRVVSTGGTARFLSEAGIEVTEVKEQTDFPEVMGGRVRTLHPRIHVPLLARHWDNGDQDLLEELGLESFDLVVCNLYPFDQAIQDESKTPREISEMIDIGGPTLLRAAAKNWESVTVVCDPADYEEISSQEKGSPELARRLTAKVFSHVSSYDSMIASHFAKSELFSTHSTGGKLHSELRYGENPQQSARWFGFRGENWGLHEASTLQGKALSYNNILDLDAAVNTLREFREPTAISVKHNNPCGIASAKNPLEALKLSLRADPVSVFGGIVAINFELKEEMALELKSMFLECVIAPKVEDKAARLLSQKKNLRVLEWPRMCENRVIRAPFRSVLGGYLIQAPDHISEFNDTWEVFGREPTEEERGNLSFAWKSVARLKSNAIAICSLRQTLGMGMGQVNRVDAVKQSIERWKEHHPQVDKGIVLASDAFFPFPDSVEIASSAGVEWIIQPGGSIKDDKVKETASELGINMIFTGERHFLH